VGNGPNKTTSAEGSPGKLISQSTHVRTGELGGFLWKVVNEVEQA